MWYLVLITHCRLLFVFSKSIDCHWVGASNFRDRVSTLLLACAIEQAKLSHVGRCSEEIEFECTAKMETGETYLQYKETKSTKMKCIFSYGKGEKWLES